MTEAEILSLYRELGSLQSVAAKANCSAQAVKRLLITHGIYPSERSRDIARLLTLGYQVEEIAEELGISPKGVRCNMPYVKGSYVFGAKSINAKRIAKCRSKK